MTTADLLDVPPPTADGDVVVGRNLSKSFGGNHALIDVSVDLRAGEVHAFVGENGAGKSTLAKIIAGVHRADEGVVLLDGTPVSFGTPHDAQRAGIAMVHQELSVIGSLSVAENVLFGVEPGSAGFINRRALARRATEFLELVGLRVPTSRATDRLSTAQKQLLEIAHVLALDARVIVLDEPTSSLATSDALHLRELIRQLRRAGHTVVLVSHDFDEVLDIADRVTCLRDGRLVSTGPASDLDHAMLIRLVTGRDVQTVTRTPTTSQGDEPAMAARGIVAPGVVAADIEVHRGEIVGIGGLVGSGRTELMRVLAGDVRPTAGRMTLAGRPYSPRDPADALKLGVSLLPESRKEQGLILHQTVAQNIELAAIDRINPGLFARSGAARGLAAEYVATLRIKVHSTDTPVSSLSGGNQQKVVLAKALATQPSVLLLDEPTKGIDVGAKAEILRIVRELAERGIAVVLVSSVLQELLDSCDRIVMMKGGRTVGSVVNIDVTEEDLARMAFTG